METGKVSKTLYFDTEMKQLTVQEYFINSPLTEKCFEIDSGVCVC
jgi:hypothetical protein